MAFRFFEIPLSSQPQVFNIQLAGVTYWMTLRWNVIAECWMLDLADSSRTPLIQGIPLVTGVDLFGQYEYLKLGGWLIVQTDFDPSAVPTFENLGTQGRLFFVVEA